MINDLAQHSAEKIWLNESLDSGFGYAIYSTRMLCQHQSKYQSIEVHETPSFGRLLRINGSFMASERDEFFYHENLVHVPACTHTAPKSALIVGGGDGGSAEELLKHNTIESVKLVEIDPAVVDLSRTFLQGIHHGVINELDGDPRLKVIIADGLQFIQNDTNLYDLIVLDLTDPGGVSEPLYTAEFYRQCALRLQKGGLLSLHIASPFAHTDRMVKTVAALKQAFKIVRPYMVSIPLYGGQWMMACASQSADPLALGAALIDSIIFERGLQHLQHYNGYTHQAAMALPNFVYRQLKPVGLR